MRRGWGLGVHRLGSGSTTPQVGAPLRTAGAHTAVKSPSAARSGQASAAVVCAARAELWSSKVGQGLHGGWAIAARGPDAPIIRVHDT